LNGSNFDIRVTDPYNPRSNIWVTVYINEFSLSDFISVGYTADQFLFSGYTLNQIIAAGYSINKLITTDGYELSDLSNVIFTKSELAQANISLYQLFNAGFSINELVTDGFTINDLSSCTFTNIQWQAAGYFSLQLFNAGFSIGTFFADGFQLSDLSSCPFTKDQWTSQNITPVQLQAAGFSLQNLLNDQYHLQDLTQTTFPSSQWLAAGFTVRQMYDAGFTILQLLSIGMPVPTFSFMISRNVFNQSGGIYPIFNNNNSFTGLQISIGNMRNMIIITIYWAYYTNISPQDGLNFSATPYYAEPTINITSFGGVPLALMTGTTDAAFYQFAGQITAVDAPTIPNHSLNSCFYGASCSNFGNMNAWDVSNTTDLTSAFENCVNFNSPLDKWSTQSITSMRNTFNGASSFTQDISMWNFSGVIPTIPQGSMYNILNGTGINPARTSKFLLAIIKAST
jgi:uncharacterized protein YjbI with pentapeptide repeats